MATAKPSESIVADVKKYWGKLKPLTNAVHEELWRHMGTLHVGEDYDDQIRDAVMTGAFVGHFASTSKDADEFMKHLEEIFLDDDKREAWWWPQGT